MQLFTGLAGKPRLYWLLDDITNFVGPSFLIYIIEIILAIVPSQGSGKDLRKKHAVQKSYAAS